MLSLVFNQAHENTPLGLMVCKVNSTHLQRIFDKMKNNHFKDNSVQVNIKH